MFGVIVHSESEFELHLGRGWLTAERSLVKHVNHNDANGYYKALGLRSDASRSEIKAAYRKSLQSLHPDLGGDGELFRFLSDVVSVLLDSKTKSVYDSVDGDHIYLGNMEREELARQGFFKREKDGQRARTQRLHWACLTSLGLAPGEDTDAWISFCWEASQAVGYRGKIRVGVVAGGDSHLPWGILASGIYTFTVFQKGVEPNRLHALCAMIDLQRHLLNQIQQKRAEAHNGERAA